MKILQQVEIVIFMPIIFAEGILSFGQYEMKSSQATHFRGSILMWIGSMSRVQPPLPHPRIHICNSQNILWIEYDWWTDQYMKLTPQETNVRCDSFTYLWSWQSIPLIIHQGQANDYNILCIQYLKDEYHLGIVSIDQSI